MSMKVIIQPTKPTEAPVIPEEPVVEAEKEAEEPELDEDPELEMEDLDLEETSNLEA